MGNIVLLDDLTINKIAAGEVIERPANVVKELVENSIDAGGTKIVIEIKNGGKTYINITDNGKGMKREDMPLSLERHATSKIRKVEDLEHTYTMGFRGEALASICAISKLTMASKEKEELIGTKIISEAGEILKAEECGMNTGTSITVENLFFNTPVRYKFLKNDAAEFKVIKDWIQKTALAEPQISFRLINNNKEVFYTSGNGKIEDIIYILYGKQIKENIVKVDHTEENIKVTGVVGNTLIARDTKKDQIIFLNKRNITNSMITNSLEQAFKGATGINKHGFAILNLSMPADYYDVNVHPTKKDVRFKDEGKIYRILFHAVKNSMLNTEFLGNNQLENQDKYIENEYEFLTNKLEKEDKNLELRKREQNRKIDYKYIGILFRTFIIIEIDNEIFLIDQHAAHERVLYEQIKENYKKNMKQNSQMTLLPEVHTLTHKEIAFVMENKEMLEKIGFDIEQFGENTIKINGIPDLEYKSKTKSLFLDILDEMILSNRTSIKDIEERFIATVACKAAVKANMDLNEQEVHKLIQSLLSLNNPYTCPHGRPTTIKISKEYLEKELGKIE